MGENGDDDAAAFVQFDGMPPLSRAAIQLHGHGIIHSINDGHPGFVSDDYLNAIRAETTLAAAELEAAGMWSRRDGGYFVVADEMVGMLIDHNEEMDRLAAACEARRSHRVDDEQQDRSWVICADCGVPLSRPDGGPVALPEGGRLGPDPRESEDDSDRHPAATGGSAGGRGSATQGRAPGIRCPHRRMSATRHGVCTVKTATKPLRF